MTSIRPAFVLTTGNVTVLIVLVTSSCTIKALVGMVDAITPLLRILIVDDAVPSYDPINRHEVAPSDNKFIDPNELLNV
jgi:hypothetical protein